MLSDPVPVALVSALRGTPTPQPLPSQAHSPSGALDGTTRASWTGVEPAGCWGPGYTPHPGTPYWTAHKTLPCGTELLVEYGSRSVVVVVADRGPYVRGRELDLSRAAFARLAPLGRGVIEVNYRSNS